MPCVFPEASLAGEQQTRSRSADQLREVPGPRARPEGLERSLEDHGHPGGRRACPERFGAGYGSRCCLRTDSSRRRRSGLTGGGTPAVFQSGDGGRRQPSGCTHTARD